MQFYDNAALSVIKLGASGQLDANWGYVWYQNFDLGTAQITLPPAEGPPCISGGNIHDIQNGILYTISTNCNSCNTNVLVTLDQGMEYRIRFGYIGLTNSFSGLFELQISMINPVGPGNGPFGTYGHGLDYWALDERPFNYTEEDNVIVDSIKTWGSNSGDAADGSTWTKLESTITLLRLQTNTLPK